MKITRSVYMHAANGLKVREERFFRRSRLTLNLKFLEDFRCQRTRNKKSDRGEREKENKSALFFYARGRPILNEVLIDTSLSYYFCSTPSSPRHRLLYIY